MRHLFSAFLIGVLFLNSQVRAQSSQTLYTGYQYLLSSDDYTPFRYTKKYVNASGVYKTIYSLYHPIKGTVAIIITVKHYKAEKKVVVEINDNSGSVFSFINKEEMTYSTPSMKLFGFRGDYAIIGGKKVPNQLALKFTNNKFEFVNVHSVIGDPESNGEFFILDK